jgi:hypothetical protein
MHYIHLGSEQQHLKTSQECLDWRREWQAQNSISNGCDLHIWTVHSRRG